jgi:hypothetical protein
MIMAKKVAAKKAPVVKGMAKKPAPILKSKPAPKKGSAKED